MSLGLELPLDDYDTSFGFRWQGVEVERLAIIKGAKVLGIKVNKTRVEIYASPGGRSVRVFKNGKELK